jgi:hypothetical protein
MTMFTPADAPLCRVPAEPEGRAARVRPGNAPPRTADHRRKSA